MLCRLPSPPFLVGKRWANNAAWFVGIRDMTGAEMFSDFDDDTETATATPKRPPGRPKGYAKTGGRKKGVPNRDSAAAIDAIIQSADPIGFLEQVCKGLLIKCHDPDSDDPKATILMRPSLDQRTDAAKYLGHKVRAGLKALELSGQVGGQGVQPDAPSDAEFNKWVAGLFPEGEDTESPPPRPKELPDQDTQMGAGAEGNAAPAAAPDQQPTPS